MHRDGSALMTLNRIQPHSRSEDTQVQSLHRLTCAQVHLQRQAKGTEAPSKADDTQTQ